MALSKIDVANMLTGVTPVANGGTALSTGFNNGGTTEVDHFRVTSSFTGSATPITSNYERSDTAGFGKLGTGLTESSGLFSFPSTGIYIIFAQMSFQFNEEDTDSILSIVTTTNNSSYTAQSTVREADKNTDGRRHSCSCMAVFDVTNVTTHKFAINAQSVASSNAVACSSDETITGVTVFRMGDT
tara:strand:- start:63 stop:620 length:558 start_codon:yes stop_codon:yes gene_type:complete